MKSSPMGCEFFHTDRRTDTDMDERTVGCTSNQTTNLTIAFRNLWNTLKKTGIY